MHSTVIVLTRAVMHQLADYRQAAVTVLDIGRKRQKKKKQQQEATNVKNFSMRLKKEKKLYIQQLNDV